MLKIAQTGVSQTQIKVLALLFMTIDHLGSYGLFHSSKLNGMMRIAGRLAAPLFLYAVVISTRETKNINAFIKRLYLSNLLMNFGISILDLMAPSHIWTEITPANIFGTFFYVVLLIHAIGSCYEAYRHKRWMQAIKIASCTLVIIILGRVYFCVVDSLISSVSAPQLTELRYVIEAIFPDLFQVEYSMMFVLMGVCMYFSKTKLSQSIVLMMFSLLSACAFLRYDWWPFNDFFAPKQYWMFLAIPFIMLYNGERGKGNKYFFYFYYPLHICILNIVDTL